MIAYNMPIVTKLNKTVPGKKRISLAVLFCLIQSCLLASGNLQAEESRLVVTLQGVRDDVGNLRLSLYRDPETFRKEDRAVKIISLPALKGDAVVAFDKLAPGRYAIMAYHDENADQKLNLRFGMFPLEGYGLSNNPKVMGPPKFADSAFGITGPETAIDIKLTY